jgi:catechol 2,3-dioxygenase-like lactoylglutathione lyase family enzyme
MKSSRDSKTIDRMAHIGHIILNVSDFKTSESFYDRLLISVGFDVDYREEDSNGAAKSYCLNEHNIWIKFDPSVKSQSFVRNVGLDHLAIFVDSSIEVDRIHNELSVSGAVITRPPTYYSEYSDTYYAFYFRDPDGIPLEVAVP